MLLNDSYLLLHFVLRSLELVNCLDVVLNHFLACVKLRIYHDGADIGDQILCNYIQILIALVLLVLHLKVHLPNGLARS